MRQEVCQAHIIKTHQEAKHESLRYFCNQCDYQAMEPRSLKRHQQYKHEGVGYLCQLREQPRLFEQYH